jgi:hypothetical protein
MINYHKISRYLIILLITIFLISSATMLSCGNGEPREKYIYIIESTYDCLRHKAEQLQGIYASMKVLSISWDFTNAVSKASMDYLKKYNKWGESIEISFPSPIQSYKIPASLEGLKSIVKPTGDGLWEISIDEIKWQYNENTDEVTANNTEAIKLMEEITLKTYTNTKYNYSFNYPPSWNVLFEPLEGSVTISLVDEDDLTMKAAIMVFCIPKVLALRDLTIRELAEDRVQSYPNDSYEINTAYGNTTVNALVVDIKGLKFKNLEAIGVHNSYEAKFYFFEKDDMVYEIQTVGKLYEPSLNDSFLFDPYTSFKFNN